MKKLFGKFGYMSYEVSLNDMYEIIKDVYETSDLKEKGKYNLDDVKLAVDRVLEKQEGGE
jgi:hypothetical protein